MDAGIYCIVNTKNNKLYIGLTINLKTRWRYHIYLLRSNKHGNKHLQSAFNKYGEQFFVYKILERTSDINNRERFWIDFFGGCNSKKLYNKSSGGENGFVRSEETKKKCSEWQKGRKLSKEHVQNIINANKGKRNHTESHKIYLSKLYTGRKLSKDTIEKIRIAKRGKKMPEAQRLKRLGQGAKPVIQCRLNGEKINEFKSAKDAGNILGFWKSDITQCCLGNRKTVKGYIFKYK